ncbi:MAG: hypothetical protein EZS28_027490 [Streblomastix strix]|uniref:Centromere protein S n=1 Tax=Streblomastix strix TaxID=222440 RepID=A0A5J4V390_9EUKA|nr:MAG: hypothetical protein EZS28_027490 [Streblomastix strix]
MMQKDSSGKSERSESANIQQMKSQFFMAVDSVLKQKAEEENVEFQSQLRAILAEVLAQYSEIMISDVERFCIHAKRKTVTVEDVLLFTRRNNELTEKLKQFLARQNETGDASKSLTKGKRGNRNKETEKEKMEKDDPNIKLETDEFNQELNGEDIGQELNEIDNGTGDGDVIGSKEDVDEWGNAVDEDQKQAG